MIITVTPGDQPGVLVNKKKDRTSLINDYNYIIILLLVSGEVNSTVCIIIIISPATANHCSAEGECR